MSNHRCQENPTGNDCLNYATWRGRKGSAKRVVLTSSGQPVQTNDVVGLPELCPERLFRFDDKTRCARASMWSSVEMIDNVSGMDRKKWSGREDLNLRPPQPHCGALPGCATPREGVHDTGTEPWAESRLSHRSVAHGGRAPPGRGAQRLSMFSTSSSSTLSWRMICWLWLTSTLASSPESR